MLHRFPVNCRFALGRRIETHLHADVARAKVGCHNDDGIGEINRSSEAIGQATFVEQLQQQIVHFRMRFFNFIEQQYTKGAIAHLACQLPLGVVKIADQALHRRAVDVLIHIETQEMILTAHQIIAKHFRRLRFTYACWSDKQKRTHRFGAIHQFCLAEMDNVFEGCHRPRLPDKLLGQRLVYRLSLQTLACVNQALPQPTRRLKLFPHLGRINATEPIFCSQQMQ